MSFVKMFIHFRRKKKNNMKTNKKIHCLVSPTVLIIYCAWKEIINTSATLPGPLCYGSIKFREDSAAVFISSINVSFCTAFRDVVTIVVVASIKKHIRFENRGRLKVCKRNGRFARVTRLRDSMYRPVRLSNLHSIGSRVYFI